MGKLSNNILLTDLK